jgi:hypothetical protein
MKSSDCVVVGTLKKRYFEIALKENYPNTPNLTAELDNLERAIREFESGNKNQHGITKSKIF